MITHGTIPGAAHDATLTAAISPGNPLVPLVDLTIATHADGRHDQGTVTVTTADAHNIAAAIDGTYPPGYVAFTDANWGGIQVTPGPDTIDVTIVEHRGPVTIDVTVTLQRDDYNLTAAANMLRAVASRAAHPTARGQRH